MRKISERVKARRNELNLSQCELARIVGMKQQSLQAIEAGITKRPRRLLELASALGCEPGWLLFGDDVPLTTGSDHAA
ncbi:helix-turn-helix domain-containing protein [Pantoea vagans]|uniref:helix-turn-helix domain-containing protein n=1 Tax=Pantoea vagans TaxID=470934 RepID=UPI0023B1D9AC|nr:helix-turn-helix domain-containing protein [Pantoea vagans]MDE8556091.1 helix-turn-helix domain-containing protein [Pantoea vagans]MDE8576142.1 helix-turn-helix domain-containing protein [Pantoea vagans]